MPSVYHIPGKFDGKTGTLSALRRAMMAIEACDVNNGGSLVDRNFLSNKQKKSCIVIIRMEDRVMRQKPVVEYLTDEELEEILQAKMSSEYDYLNAELADWKPEESTPDIEFIPQRIVVVRR